MTNSYSLYCFGSQLEEKKSFDMKSDAVWPPANLGLLGGLAAHGYRGLAPLKGPAVLQSP